MSTLFPWVHQPNCSQQGGRRKPLESPWFGPEGAFSLGSRKTEGARAARIFAIYATVGAANAGVLTRAGVSAPGLEYREKAVLRFSVTR